MKVLSVIKYVFSTIGVLSLLGAAAAYKSSSDFLDEAVPASGKVVALVKSRSSDSVSFYPVIQFLDEEGRSFEFRSNAGSNPPTFLVGEEVRVLYAAEHPEDAKVDAFFALWGVSLVLAVIGGPFLFIGMLMVTIGRLRTRKHAYLQKNGVAIEAKFQSVERNFRLSVNGRNPYLIMCQWLNPQTSQVHMFQSENIWFDPSLYIKDESIRVLIERNNPKKYHVDISFLPKAAG
ncbi:DUF3592 domain-containing protein [Pseudomonas sp. BJa5]|uniref:DUF3592 domain-containing protein n=1 Tax=Pseudomonas sp. BJa5 TaxID=2936270 RepID=UPI0025596FAA|nr:DUF3592 domain-containing protein [Pseudomonas sp. BGr12]MDL2423418.1 DUF3592 domain-containing protein [Pseudomonas sp. BGr12]